MQNKSVFLVVILAVLVAIGGAGAMWYKNNQVSEGEIDIAAHQDETGAAADNAVMSPAPTLEQASPAAGETATATTSASDIQIVTDGADPKAPKSIGKIDAPVTMYDFSSLTCPHCAHAHAQIMPQLIKEYVETGKLRIVFSDFPLNQQAMDASKISRCVANDRYFSFLSMLFSTQDQWAFSPNYQQSLIQNAVMAGLTEERAKQCLEDKDVERALITGIQDGVTKYKVSATPTFVLNDGAKTIAGARPYEDFKAAIDALLPAGQ